MCCTDSGNRRLKKPVGTDKVHKNGQVQGECYVF